MRQNTRVRFSIPSRPAPFFDDHRPLVDIGKLRRVEFDGQLPFWLTSPGSSLEPLYHVVHDICEARSLLVEPVRVAFVADHPMENVPSMYGFHPLQFLRVFKPFPSPRSTYDIRENQGKIHLYEGERARVPDLLVFEPRFVAARVLMEGIVSEAIRPLSFNQIREYASSS